MPRILTRPTKESVEQIEKCLLESDLTPKARLQLRAVMAWARGKTSRQVASDRALKMSDFSVRAAINRFIAKGLEAFTNPPSGAPGRRKISADVVRAVAADMKSAIESGAPLPYRDLAMKHGISLGKVSAIAKANKFDAANRRGPLRSTTVSRIQAIS